ncbi:2-dehydropantoate 2-reductase [Hesseltinella vesiculosa]|uniref:2-dehydropantoate 2-reductase n=1 Tax=Hesseltinella vesiculosa TaxID=101127 RepID=A0A1X2GNW8_9FUNG|nr:2-dehydropantoate 2-reductase [Hesseltinella vesiculosa]
MAGRCSILTVGTGAVGAIYSWRLAKSAAVTTLCRSNYQAVKDNGFNIESKKFGQEVFHPDHVAKSVSEAVRANGKAFDYALVTLKALPEMYNVADIISPAVTPGKTAIVLIQNGLGVEEPLVDRFPDNPLISVVAYIGTSQHKQGHIQMVGTERLMVGNYLPAKADNREAKKTFIDLLLKGGVDAHDVDDIEKLRWQKLFWNASFSPACLLTSMNTSQLMANESSMNMVGNVMRDVISVANAQGYGFDPDEQLQQMIKFTEITAQNYKPSMQLDFERRQPMEVDAILGACYRRAKALDMKVPYLEMAYDLCNAHNQTILQEKNISA